MSNNTSVHPFIVATCTIHITSHYTIRKNILSIITIKLTFTTFFAFHFTRTSSTKREITSIFFHNNNFIIVVSTMHHPTGKDIAKSQIPRWYLA